MLKEFHFQNPKEATRIPEQKHPRLQLLNEHNSRLVSNVLQVEVEKKRNWIF